MFCFTKTNVNLKIFVFVIGILLIMFAGVYFRQPISYYQHNKRFSQHMNGMFYLTFIIGRNSP